MKLSILIVAVVIATTALVSRPAEAKRSECKSGEELDFSIPEVKPDWVDSPHARSGRTEYFVGLSTQNEKLEDGITLAVENANGAIVEALGQVIRRQSQGVLSFESDEIRQSWGSAGAASYLKHKERKAIYYEKWAHYERCQPKYHYNVWVQVAVPKSEFDAEAVRAESYLREIQRAEEAKAKPALMPTQEAMQVKAAPKSKKGVEAAPTASGNYSNTQILNSLTSFTGAAPEQWKPYEFHCGSVGFYGGYTYIPGANSEMGRHTSGIANINADMEFGLTRNFCMGVGMGWAMTKMENGGKGQIVPMFLRFSYKGPFDSNGRFIGWAGVEVGGAILHNFDSKGTWGGEQKTTGAFMAGPAAGVDIRVQKNLYLTISGAYTPIFYKETIHMVEGRVGLRYYFGSW